MWEYYGVCSCGHREFAWMGRRFYIRSEVCPTCGEHKDLWDIRISKEIYHGVIWKPSTWLKWSWLDKEK